MLPEAITAAAAGVFGYHHFVYPVALQVLGTRARLDRRDHVRMLAPSELPRITVVVPAHNEAGVIARKIDNCAQLDYPRDKLKIIVCCDGCTDATAALARAAAEAWCDTSIEIVELTRNIGKVAVLNEIVAQVDSGIVAPSDASAMLEPDALMRSVQHFADAKVGVVCPTYRLKAAGSEGERAYWTYQRRIKEDEAALGAPMGAHGAFYLFRRANWAPLPADTINDDVIIPMRIVAAGYRGVYDSTIASTEIETTKPAQEWRRRVRIGAGNVQQLIRLKALASPARPGLAFVFLSGKGMRAAIPFLVIAAFIASAVSAAQGDPVMSALLTLQLSIAVLALIAVAYKGAALPRPLTWLGYLVEGHAASFVGASRYLLGLESKPWKRATVWSDVVVTETEPTEENYVPKAVLVGKRVVDIVCGLGALAVLAVLFIPIALAIKLDSRGPLFYRQLRVGRVTPTTTYLFHLIKFRTMRTDAESSTGAVWATKDDPRITRVGRFMRKSRLDELPQCFNVLMGEMSAIGPRPERPSFFQKLEDAIPFYSERTYGLKPGITGLAQVNQAYDASIEDVRNKVLYDHAYAARLTNWREWLRTDFGIVFKTVTVMALGKGQ